MSMNFFETLNAACAVRNAELDRKYEEERQLAAVAQAKKEEESRLAKREWAVRLLEEGKVSVETSESKVHGAMMVLITDEEVWRNEVDRLLMKNEQYRPLINQPLLEKFLEHGGDPAGQLGAYCVTQALALEPGLDFFEPEAAGPLAMALMVLARIGNSEDPKVAGAYKLLRRLVPFARKGNLQNIPHKLGMKLYPEHYEKNGKCKHHFASRSDEGEARVVSRPHDERGDRPCPENHRDGNGRRPTIPTPLPREKYAQAENLEPTDEAISDTENQNDNHPARLSPPATATIGEILMAKATVH